MFPCFCPQAFFEVGTSVRFVGAFVLCGLAEGVLVDPWVATCTAIEVWKRVMCILLGPGGPVLAVVLPDIRASRAYLLDKSFISIGNSQEG